jgi:hypothetical protein
MIRYWPSAQTARSWTVKKLRRFLLHIRKKPSVTVAGCLLPRVDPDSGNLTGWHHNLGRRKDKGRPHVSSCNLMRYCDCLSFSIRFILFPSSTLPWGSRPLPSTTTTEKDGKSPAAKASVWLCPTRLTRPLGCQSIGHAIIVCLPIKRIKIYLHLLYPLKRVGFTARREGAFLSTSSPTFHIGHLHCRLPSVRFSNRLRPLPLRRSSALAQPGVREI